MLHLALRTVFSIALLVYMVYGVAVPQKRNYKDVRLEEFDINEVGEEVHKSTYFDIKTGKGGKTKGVGILKVTKDFPPTTTVQWKAFYINDDNQLTKQAEGKRSTLCDFMVKEKPMADMMLKESNLTSCLIKKGVYEFRKCAANMNALPPKLPENRNSWLLEIILSAGKRILFSVRATATIIRN